MQRGAIAAVRQDGDQVRWQIGQHEPGDVARQVAAHAIALDETHADRS
ncbi:hypothetical protein [Burkholderia sp. SIMBA_062]